MVLWQIWASAALLFVILEIFTNGFAVACFSFGAVAAAVCDACALSLLWQFFAFAVVSALALWFVRPMVMKLFYGKKEEVTNVDAILGRQGRVSEKIDPSTGRGRVALDGDDWKAVSSDGSVIEKGENVEIINRDSVIVTVKKIQ